MAGRALPACGPRSESPGDAALSSEAGDALGPDAAMTDAAMTDAAMTDASVTDAMTDTVTDAAADGGRVFARRMLPPRPALRSLIADIGPLEAMPDANGLRLPRGFTSRVVAEFDRRVGPSPYSWHIAPDGGATFITEDGGWIYVSNSETFVDMGGVGTIRFDRDGRIVDAKRILNRTNMNCAGGPTPWHTWLSCEEIGRGEVWECDPWGEQPPIARPALGVFTHEAVTVDHDRGHLYLTEDLGDGRLYRFVPAGMNANGFPDLSRGTLEVAVVDMSNRVTWRALPDPQYTGEVPTRDQVRESTPFNGGEGVWYHQHVVYFSTKGDNRVWALDVRTSTLSVLYDAATQPEPAMLTGVDNITVSCCGDVLVAEDQGSMDIVAILPSGALKQLVQVTGQDGSEITGPAFDPSGTRLYFSSQRSPAGGTTYEITGPFHAPR